MNYVEISDSEGLEVRLSTFGARVVRVQFHAKDVALRYKDLSEYLGDPFYLGATVGPIANRIKNGCLRVNGELFQLPLNEPASCLHGGGPEFGFECRNWSLFEQSDSQVTFGLVYDLASIGMRGQLEVQAVYRVVSGVLFVEYHARSDTTTYINLTNHVYWNLSGAGEQSANTCISDHEFRLYGNAYINVDDDNLPDGTITPWRKSQVCNIDDRGDVDALAGFGNHYFMIANDGAMRLIGEAKSKETGTALRIKSTAPGFVFYTGIALSEPFVSSGGFCFETQLAPDAINQHNFYAPLLFAGERHSQFTRYELYETGYESCY